MHTISILIMDDVSYIRQLITGDLSGFQGVKVIYEADNPSTALQIIGVYCPEVIILDINVPSAIFEDTSYANGIDVLRAAKQRLPHSTIMMLTNNANEYYRRECLNAGADFFFDKTVEFEAFLTQVQQLIPELGREGDREIGKSVGQ